MGESFDRKLLEQKKRKYLEAVWAACDSKKLGYPTVNFDYCPDEKENQLSHCHTALYRICVSERQLYMLNFDDIFEVATHEVTHLIEEEHGAHFVAEHTDIKVKSWRPPPGVYHIRGNRKAVKLRKRKVRANECRYHSCKRDAKIKCQYCGDMFCEEHCPAHLVLSRYRIDSAPSYLRAEYEAEYRKRSGHACPDFDTAWHEMRQNNTNQATSEKAEGVDSRSNKMCDYCKIVFDSTMAFFTCDLCKKHLCMYHSRPELHHCTGVDWEAKKQQKYEETERKFEHLKKELEMKYWFKQIAKVLLLGIIVFAALYALGIFNPLEKECSDGTISNACSVNKPYLCKNGDFIYDANRCGCPEGQIIDNGACRELRPCSDGTMHNSCSLTKPFFCNDGNLSSNPSSCGCPEGYLFETGICRLIVNCLDGTDDTKCSANKPLYCYNGTLTEKASMCGCSENAMINGDRCDNVELMIHELINNERVANGLPTLAFDDKLASIARMHSKDMALRYYFSHDTPEGLDPTDRGNSAGYSCYKNFGSYYTVGIAENIFSTATYTSIWYTNGIETSRDYQTSQQLAQQIVTGWMNSPGHRQNILTNTYDREGIGVYISNSGEVLVTEDFC